MEFAVVWGQKFRSSPVATRFVTYGVTLGAEAQRYVAALRALPALAEWYRDAERETEVIAHCEPYQARSQAAGLQVAGSQAAESQAAGVQAPR